MNLPMLESTAQTDRNQILVTKPLSKGHLTAKWLVVNNKLICKWITT